jgi:ABC-type glutathione transport system ATPase component
MTAVPVLEVDGLSVDLDAGEGPATVLRDLSMRLEAGQAFGLVGESGAGKSTLVHAILGLLPKSARTRGSILVEGEQVVGRSEAELRRIRGARVSVVLQDPATALNPLWPVGAQVAEAVAAHQQLSRSELRDRAVGLLAAAGIPDAPERFLAYPHELSGGLRQRVAIAIAMANDPALIVADEPTSALDASVRHHVLDGLATPRQRTGAALLLISHDLGVVEGSVDMVGVLHAGELIEVGPAGDVLRSPRAPFTSELVASRLHLRVPPRPTARRDAGPPVLVARDLVREHPRRRPTSGGGPAVSGVSLELHSGETLGLVGESGSGKTTLARLLAGIESPTAGSIDYQGRPLSTMGRSPRRAFRRAVQFVPQDPAAALDPLMTIGVAVTEPLRIGRTPRDEREDRLAELLGEVGLPASHLVHRYPHELSAGQRQRVVIARALAMEPTVLLLDEPVSLLDATTRAEVLRLLRQLQEQLGLTFLLVSHDLAVVQHMADRIAVMHEGRIVEIAGAAELVQSPRDPYTRGLVAAARALS